MNESINYIKFNDNNILYFPLSCSFSQGQALETVSRFSRDASKTSQSISRRRYLKAKTYSINYSLNHFNSNDIISDIYFLEDAVGQVGTLFHAGLEEGQVVVGGVSFALSIDALGEIYQASITLNVMAGYVPKKQPQQTIRNL